MKLKIKNFLKLVLKRLKYISLFLFSKNSTLASIYYVLFSKEFKNEQLAVLLGKLNYYKSDGVNSDSSALLRRNVHRIEKGLIMRPRRAVFGLAYLNETIDCYTRASFNSNISKSQEFLWDYDVLSKYLNVVDRNNEIISCCFDKFTKVSPLHQNENKLVPYEKKSIVRAAISYEELTLLFKQRRSNRWFIDRKVDINIFKEAVEISSQAPSACNRQPFKFIFSNDKSKVKKIAESAMGTAGFSDNIPSIVAVIGDLSCYPFERDRHVIYIDSSLASMQLLLSLEILGLNSCVINWPDIVARDKKISELLGLKPHEKVVMLIAVGYGDEQGLIPFSQKKTADELVIEVK